MKTIVTFGDSITDMGRWRDSDTTGFSYGVGYPLLLKEYFERHDIKVNLINRGCGGDSTTNLLERIETDVIALKPDILTILIGTNDVWHQYEGCEDHHGNKIEQFEANYRKILETVKTKSPNTKIIIFAPFFLALDEPTRKGFWEHMKMLYSYAEVVEKLAKEYHCAFSKLQPLMDGGKEKYGTTNILYDGIHPNVRGSIILEEEFLKQITNYL